MNNNSQSLSVGNNNIPIHQRNKLIVKDWWHANEDIASKKLRRKQYRIAKENAKLKQSKNTLKLPVNQTKKENEISSVPKRERRKIHVGKGDKKRFYSVPKQSWNELVFAPISKEEDIEEDEESEDIDIDFSDEQHLKTNTNFDQYLHTFSDNEEKGNENEFTVDDDLDIENDDKNYSQLSLDLKTNENESEKCDINHINIGDTEELNLQAINDEIWDRNTGRCKLHLDLKNKYTFYRNETEVEMWDNFQKLKTQFKFTCGKHKKWYLRKQAEREIKKLAVTVEERTEEEEDI